MPANSERSIAQHIGNFKLVIDKCSTFGAQYNPSNPLLTIASLTDSWSNTFALHDTYNDLLMACKHPVNARQDLYRRVRRIVTRTLNYFQSTDASDLIIKDAKGIADRLRGHGVLRKKLADGSYDPNHISNSHLSYPQRLESFRQLCALYGSSAHYAPNEADIQLSALNALVDEMQLANDGMSALLAPVITARIARDGALYNENTGLYRLVRAVKLYVKAVFGASSPEYRSIARIQFKQGSVKRLDY